MSHGGVLLISVNWLGDAVMALPALQLWRQTDPTSPLTVLTKPGLADFWRQIPAVQSVITLPPGLVGTCAAVDRVRNGNFRVAWILPNSFRSAWIPWRANVPCRRGLPGHWRRAMLTEMAAPVCRPRSVQTMSGTEPATTGSGCPTASSRPESPNPRHQAWEALAVLNLPPQPLPSPLVPVDSRKCDHVAKRFALNPETPLLGVFPGAARGPAKRWPMDLLVETLERVRSQVDGLRIVMLGSRSETALCAEAAAQVGSAACSLAGQTDLPDLAACLRLCHAILCNDSGGMHLSAAVGTPSVAIFGLTDPEVTGPLGNTSIILRPPGTHPHGKRRIARNSASAIAALRQIRPDRVARTLVQVLQQRSPA